MATTLPTLTPENLGIVLRIASIIECAHDDHPKDEKRAIGSVIGGLERLFPVNAKLMGKIIVSAREEWLHQSPSASHYLTLSQWQAIRIFEGSFSELEEKAKA